MENGQPGLWSKKENKDRTNQPQKIKSTERRRRSRVGARRDVERKKRRLSQVALMDSNDEQYQCAHEVQRPETTRLMIPSIFRIWPIVFCLEDPAILPCLLWYCRDHLTACDLPPTYSLFYLTAYYVGLSIRMSSDVFRWFTATFLWIYISTDYLLQSSIEIFHKFVQYLAETIHELSWHSLLGSLYLPQRATLPVIPQLVSS